jgi:membrane associated rhomboid family serine protease
MIVSFGPVRAWLGCHGQIAISAAAFGMVIGFLSGYSVRAYISFLHRRERLSLEGLYRLDAVTRKPFLRSM